MATEQNLYFKIKVLTPTHVGMDKEKEWMNGLDFVVEEKNNEVLVLNRDALFRKLKHSSMLGNYTSALLNGGSPQDMLKFLNSKQLLSPDIILKRYKTYTSSIDTIKPQLHDGLGRHYIPGSSIKGALRSIIGKKLLNGNTINRNNDFENLFGDINNNLMRMVQVSDAYLNQTTLVNTKIFSADGRPENGEGTWKDKNQGGHNAEFKHDKFSPSFEALAANATAKLKIKFIGIDDFHENYRAGINVPNHRHIAQIRQDFVSIVNNHFNEYIVKEIEYYNKYENQTLGNQAIDFYSKLQQVDSNNTCILRLGGNVGYHAITGDMVYPNHLIWIGQDNNRQRHKNQIKAKTRKFAFSKNNGEWQFLPMGWVKLELIDETEYDKLKTEEPTAASTKLQDVNTVSVSEAPKPIEKKPIEPKPYTGKIKDGAIVDAKVISSENGQIKAELFIENKSGIIQSFRYPAGISVNSYIKVELIQVTKKEEIKAIKFKSML